MKLHVYSVFDKAVGAYLQPFYARSNGEALRSFSEACNNGSSQFAKHAIDYTLVRLGEWDDCSGLFVTVDPQRVISASEVVVADDPFTEDKKIVDVTPKQRVAM
jgi:predicted acyl esterase